MEKLSFKILENSYVKEATNLVISNYLEEKKHIPYLPDEKDFYDVIFYNLKQIFKNQNGILVFENDKLIGFISGFEINELFGKAKGIYCPLYAHSADKENRQNIYKFMYEKVSQLWVDNGFLTHAITIYCQDIESINTWFCLGFGNRCVDAIRKASRIELYKSDVFVKKACIEDLSHIKELHRKHNNYYFQAPLFMPSYTENTIEDLAQWLAVENNHLWIAYVNGKALGYMKIQNEGETFISEHKNIMNITGAYVEEESRGSNIGTALLSNIQEWLIDNNYTLCGVDYESFNILGSAFWNKYFLPYTFSVVRRIDERIISHKKF